MTTIDNFVSIREINKDDINFLIHSSLLCLTKYKESITKGQNHTESYQTLEKIILCGLTNMGYSIFIACQKEDSNNIVGYLVADTSENHVFLQYTKYAYRKLGIQKNLLLPLAIDPSQPITVNWPTKEMLKLAAVGAVSIHNKFTEKLIQTLFDLTQNA